MGVVSRLGEVKGLLRCEWLVGPLELFGLGELRRMLRVCLTCLVVYEVLFCDLPNLKTKEYRGVNTRHE